MMVTILPSQFNGRRTKASVGPLGGKCQGLHPIRLTSDPGTVKPRGVSQYAIHTILVLPVEFEFIFTRDKTIELSLPFKDQRPHSLET